MKKLFYITVLLLIALASIVYAKSAFNIFTSTRSNSYFLQTMAGSRSGYDFLWSWSFEDSLDADKGGMVGTIERDSAASYIDTDGILQIADGDSTPFSHASIEDETGATSITGDFTDSAADLIDDASILDGYLSTGNLVIVEDDAGLFAYGYMGAASGDGCQIYQDYELNNRGWNAVDTGFDTANLTAFDVYENLISSTGSTAQPRFEENGLLSEGEGTNWCLQSNDMTEAVWTATNITPLKDVTGVDGETNSASRLTATAGNGTILQSINTLSSATHAYSVWLKRITGTGDIDLTDNNGTNWTTKTLTSEWQRFNVTRSQTDPIVGIRIVTSGDVIAAQFNQVEEGQAYITSAIPTTDIPVTRTADSHSWAMSTAFKNLMGDVADSPFTMVCEWTPKFSFGDTDANENVITTSNQFNTQFYHQIGGSLQAYTGEGSSVDPKYTATTTYTFALRVYDDAGTMKFEVGEKHGDSWTWDATPATYDGSFNPSTNLLIGYLNQYPFNIKNLKFYDSTKTQAWIEAQYPNADTTATMGGESVTMDGEAVTMGI